MDSNPNAYFGCDASGTINSFGLMFSSSGYGYSFQSPDVINNHVATPSTNHKLGKPYCSIYLNLKFGKTCGDLNFNNSLGGEFYDYLENKINSTTSISSMTSISVICNGNPIIYPVKNSIVTFNQSEDGNPKLEFTTVTQSRLGCNYQYNETNYMSFVCNSSGGVDAIQYKCGL